MKQRALALLLLLACLFACPAAAQATDEAAYDSFFDQQVFVGDSITRHLKIYLKEQAAKGISVPEPVFLTAQSYMLYTASRRNLLERHTNILWRGREVPLREAVAEIKPGRVFILLGVNDYAGEDIPKHIGYCERIVDLLATPDTRLYFFSLTPVTRRFSGSGDRRAQWDEYNLALEEMCLSKGAFFIDIATPLKDGEGYLKEEYCSDGLYHLSPAGLRVWLDTLRDYARQQYEQGLWSPEKEALQ